MKSLLKPNMVACCSLRTRSPLALALLIAVVACGVLPPTTAQAQVQQGDLEKWIAHLERTVPATAAGYVTPPDQQVAAAADAIELWGYQLARLEPTATPASIVNSCDRLGQAHRRLEQLLEKTFESRTQMVQVEPEAARHAAARAFLRTTSRLIDLSGRMRYLLSDLLNAAAYRLASQPQAREQLIDRLIAQQSTIGAEVMSPALFDPPANSPNGALPCTTEVKLKLLKLIAVTGCVDLLPQLASLATSLNTVPELTVAAAQTIRAVGLPQNERPNQNDDTVPKPAITASRLYEVLKNIPATQLSAASQSQRQELLDWLDVRQKKGIVEDTYRLGRYELQAGDWLLMRNPSPYNLFTDLSPGLFTHVGVLAWEDGTDGQRRLVLVDLPEQGSSMPATNIEAFVPRTTHYVFLRHPEAAVARTMGQTAGTVIGNPTEFDLNFRTGRVAELKGKPLAGQSIRTYCAGFLLLCSQETGLPREAFFPLPEGVAGGNTEVNLAKLGLSIGDDFISPSGALFSPHLKIVARREPMYDPRRSVEEGIFDHFAWGLEHSQLSASPDWYQSLRLKLAQASKNNPLLAQALAQAVGVSSGMDLVAAAKAAVVVESLDEVAYANSGDFRWAWVGLYYPGTPEQLAAEGFTAEEVQKVREARARHPDLQKRIAARQLTVFQLRKELVKFYVSRGKQQLNDRFFGGTSAVRAN